MEETTRSPSVIRFGVFEVDLRAGELRKQGLKIKLQEQPFQILAMLLEHPGEVVTREELQKKLWPADTFVDFDHGLNKAINKIREALGDEAENPRFVETLARRGYRFIAPVNTTLTPGPSPGGRGEPEVALASQPSPAGRGWSRPVGPGEGAPAISAARTPPLQTRWLLAVGAGALALAALAYWLTRPLPPPRIVRTTQITKFGQVALGDTDQEGFSYLVTDATWIYFNKFEGGRFGLAQVSAAGGETRTVPAPSDMPVLGLLDISSDGSKLLVLEFSGETRRDDPLWVMPATGGVPSRVGDLMAHDGTWSPDGEQLVYANGDDLFFARVDGSESRKLLSAPGGIFCPRWSPDTKRLRFTVRDPHTASLSLWEASADGSNARPLFPGRNNPPDDCCGNWTPNGEFFVFQSTRDGMTNVWAIREKGGLFRKTGREPVQLTTGPLEFFGPVLSKDGKKLFVTGLRLHTDLLRYDSKSRQLVPYTPAHAKTPVIFPTYSRDGNWVAALSPPDESLWRSRTDGSERLQLTFPPMRVWLPRWSPDGQWIAFMGKMPGRPWKIYLVSPQGGSVRELLPEVSNQADPNWSPDGNSLVFGPPPDYMADRSVPKAIYVMDLKTRGLSKLPGSGGLFSPRWSPDGRYIAAMPLDHGKLMLFDFTTVKWRELARRSVAHPEWTRDSRYIYFFNFGQGGQQFGQFALWRVRVSNLQLELVARAKDVQRPDVTGVGFAGLAADNSPLIWVDQSTADIYALEWEAP